MILRNLSLYSWPKAITYNIHPFSRLHRDNLATSSVISCYQSSKFGQLCSFSLKMPSFRARGHLTEEDLLIRTKYSTINCSFGFSRCLPSHQYRKSSIPQSERRQFAAKIDNSRNPQYKLGIFNIFKTFFRELFTALTLMYTQSFTL